MEARRGPALLAGLLSLLLALIAARPAAAHAELESSDPQDAAVLATAPRAVSFTFGETLIAQGNAITATDVASGSRVALGPVSVSGDTVTASWPPDATAAEYRVAYRVVSADGHPIQGAISFSIRGAAASASGSGASSPTAAPAPTESALPGAAAAGTTGPEPVAATDAGATSATTPLPWVLAGAALLAAAVLGWVAWTRRRPRGS